MSKNPYPSRAETFLVVGPAENELGDTEGCLDTEGLSETDGRNDGCEDTEGAIVGAKEGAVDGPD